MIIPRSGTNAKGKCLLIISLKHFFHNLIVFEAVLWNFFCFNSPPFHKTVHFETELWKTVRVLHGEFHNSFVFFMILWNF